MGLFGDSFDFLDDIGDTVGDFFGGEDNFFGELIGSAGKALTSILGESSPTVGAYRGQLTRDRTQEFGTRDLSPPGTNKVLSSEDIQRLHDVWLSRMRDFAYLKGIHDDTMGGRK
jgi:hypothetical protein